jgi:hypothetical protein
MAHSQFEHVQPAMTPKEAEDVIALWLKRTADQGLQPNASINDVAGALNLPPEEVARMLSQVRTRTTASQKSQVFAQSIKWLGIGALALFVMFCLAATSFLMGLNSGRHSSGFGMYSVTPAQPPHGYSVTFDGYTVPGGTSEYSDPLRNQNLIERALQKAVSAMNSRSPALGTVPIDHSTLTDALSKGEPLKGILAFRDAEVKHGRLTKTGKIPVLLVFNPQMEMLVQDEQDRRIKQLASSIMRGDNDAKNTPPPSGN